MPMTKQEAESLTELLEGDPATDNGSIKGALDGGLTREDIEWNQRLERDWAYHPKDAKEEAALRVDYYVRNGLDEATAKDIVAGK